MCFSRWFTRLIRVFFPFNARVRPSILTGLDLMLLELQQERWRSSFHICVSVLIIDYPLCFVCCCILTAIVRTDYYNCSCWWLLIDCWTLIDVCVYSFCFVKIIDMILYIFCCDVRFCIVLFGSIFSLSSLLFFSLLFFLLTFRQFVLFGSDMSGLLSIQRVWIFGLLHLVSELRFCIFLSFDVYSV